MGVRFGLGRSVALLGCLALAATPALLVLPGPTLVPAPATATASPAPPAHRVAALPGRPNIVLITTDDQTLADLQWMPVTRRLLGGHGVTFRHALSNAPLCCPARAEILTGQLGQNNGVRFNDGPHGGFKALRDPSNTLGAWLQHAGYRTALTGKFLNRYRPRATHQAGWTRWNPAVHGIYRYHGTVFASPRGPVRHDDHVTSVISDFTVAYLRDFAAGDRPFFVWASHVAPHRARKRHHVTPPKPTARHRHDLLTEAAPSFAKPSFNAPALASGPYPRQTRNPKSPVHLQHSYTRRLQSLQDVDDAVRRVVRVLRETHELDRTYLFFTSDNGYLLGEHRLVGKNVLYREALEVPLLVRVPGAAGASASGVPVTLADLAPTISELAGATPERLQDGRSFVPVLQGRQMRWRDTQLVQAGDRRTSGPDPGWAFRGVRTQRYTYMRRITDGAEFLYDRRIDPAEDVDVAPLWQYRPVLLELVRRYAALQDCAGPACDRVFGPPPAPDGWLGPGFSRAAAPSGPPGTPPP